VGNLNPLFTLISHLAGSKYLFARQIPGTKTHGIAASPHLPAPCREAAVGTESPELALYKL
jgi:hypothetical protein